MSPGDVSSLSLSNAVAFRVRFDDDIPPPQQRYWRGLVLHRFNGRTWSGNEPNIDSRARHAVEYGGTPVSYQITMEPTRQHWVFALDVPIEWSLGQTFMARQQQLARIHPIDQRISYRAVSHTNYRLNVNLPPAFKSWYTDLPENSNPRVVELARKMREVAGSDETYIEHVLRKFNTEEFYYTLEPPALGSNPVDRFIFDTRQGFCEHYASAFAVMMRAVDIPARIVLGYQGGEVNPLGQYMIVRQADAHAWTEVWLPERGWRRVDPTAAVAPERISAGRTGAMFDGIGASWGLRAPSEFLYQMVLTWDAINANWNEWILGYGPENQNRFLEWLGMDEPDWRKMILTLLAIVITLIGLISVLLMFRYRPPRKDQAAVLYQKFIRRAGVAPERGETPLAYAHRVSVQRMEIAQAAAQITGRYLDARYGPPELAAIQELQTAVTQFARRA
jgi:transglutaminase-like putative cysteine protease